MHATTPLRLKLVLSLAAMLLSSIACAAQAPASTPPVTLTQAPVVVTESARDTLPNDYLRVGFMPSGRTVTSIGKPGARRAFVTATPLYEPPLNVASYPSYSGLVDDEKNMLVAMRCRPPQPGKVDAVLATWPNIFDAITRDVPAPPGACLVPPANLDIEMSCYAAGFDQAESFKAAPKALEYTFHYAGRIFDPDHVALAKWLADYYGIWPAFAGTGYSVKDSYTLDDTHRMTPEQMLVKSASSEYVLKNVSLADAGCRCITVDPYPGRASDPIDPEFIEKAGGDGVCTAVKKLGTGGQ